MPHELTTKEQIDKLNAALEASNKTMTVGKPLDVIDLSEMADKYLTDKAKEDLKTRTKTITRKMDDGTFFNTVYFSVAVKTGNEEKGVEAISKAINGLAEDGKIVGCLSHFATLELARLPLKAPTSVVFCFVMVNADDIPNIHLKYAGLTTDPDEAGNPIEDLSPVLEEGEFLAEIRISVALNMLGKDKDQRPEEIVKEEIDQYLAVLPKGTVVKEVVNCAISDLSVPYEVKFYNPLMGRYKQVSLDWMREAVPVENKVESFNLFLGVVYTKRDGSIVSSHMVRP